MSPFDGYLTGRQADEEHSIFEKKQSPRHRDSLASRADQKDYGLCVLPTTAQTRYQRTEAREKQRAMKKKSPKGKCGACGMLTHKWMMLEHSPDYTVAQIANFEFEGLCRFEQRWCVVVSPNGDNLFVIHKYSWQALPIREHYQSEDPHECRARDDMRISSAISTVRADRP
jgi:hypothetical protein